jgi:hypothetical protein
MRDITAYRTEISSNSMELDEKVQDAIRKGWQPYGNQYSDNGYLIQPVVKYDPEEKHHKAHHVHG